MAAPLCQKLSLGKEEPWLAHCVRSSACQRQLRDPFPWEASLINQGHKPNSA